MDSFLRTYATPLSLISFVVVGITGIMMLFDVRGGATGDIHEWAGVAFVIALVLHLVRNGRGVKAMLSLPKSKVVVSIGAVVAAVLLLIAAPIQSGGAGHGPHGGPWMVVNKISAAPISKMAPALGMTSDQAVQRLRSAGVTIKNPEQSLAQIAREQDKELPRLIAAMMTEDGTQAEPDEDL
jgi:hypothetical protein